MLAIKGELAKTDIPLFINHNSARYWFKQRYGNRFVMVDTEVKNNVKFYIYHLVYDRDSYIQSMNAIREKSPFLHHDYLTSFDEIEISEYGYVYFKKGGTCDDTKNRNINE